MSSAVRLLDNQGFNVPPGVAGYTPKVGGGQKVTDAATGGDHSDITVTAGKTYVVMADSTAGGQWLLGVATVLTATNVMWMVPVGGVLCLHVPLGYTAIHYECLASGGSLYLVELE